MSPRILTSSNQSQQEFKRLPAGQYACRCYQMIDLGTHESEYNGEKKWKHLIRFAFEFPTETEDFGKWQQPFSLFQQFTFSLNSKGAMRPFLEAWRGKPYTQTELDEWVDIFAEFIGKTMFANVVHSEKNGNTYVNVGSNMPLPKGMECPAQVNESVVYVIDEHDEKEYAKLGAKTQEKIMSSRERVF
jgi:hypothetical protein